MSDDDDVAIAGDMEPELVPGQAESGAVDHDDPDYDPDDTSASPRLGRGIPRTAATRKAMADVIANFAKQREAGGDDDEAEGNFGAYDENATPKIRKPTMPAAGAPQPAVSPSPQTTPPPAPSLDPGVQQAKAAYESKLGDLAAREQAVIAREKSADALAFRDTYAERPIHALKDQLTKLGIVTTDDEWKDEVADLVTALSGEVLGVQLPQEVRNKIEAKRALRAVKAQRASIQEREQLLDRQRQEAQAQLERSRAVESLGKELSKDEHATQYPWLTAEDNPGEIVVDVIMTRHGKDGTVMKWQDAAKLANEYLQNQATAYHQKRRHLLEQQAGAGNGTRNGNATRETTQGQRRSSAVTNNLASEAPQTSDSPPPATANGRNWNEKRRQETKRKMREAFKPQP